MKRRKGLFFFRIQREAPLGSRGLFTYLFIFIFFCLFLKSEGSLNEILKRDVESPSFEKRDFYFFYFCPLLKSESEERDILLFLSLFLIYSYFF